MSVFETILFDLDDTLLGNDMERFMPAYFSLLGAYARPVLDRERFMSALLRGTRAMIADTDPAVTNRDAFWTCFEQLTGLDAAETEAFFDRFYQDEFPKLRDVAVPRPVAISLLRYCAENGIQVVIATNPLFPRLAIEHRLQWAGVPVTAFDYALVTSYENMHATKPRPAYYREILAQVGAEAESALMVGDDWEHDVEPAAAVGMDVYWIAPAWAEPPDANLIAGYGSLDDCYRWLRRAG